MANLHPKTLAALEAGPQAVPIGADGVGVETSTMFARRIALIAMEEELERWVSECSELSAQMFIVPGALLLGEGGNPYCKLKDEIADLKERAEMFNWLLHTANREEIEETLLAREPWHKVLMLIKAKMGA